MKGNRTNHCLTPVSIMRIDRCQLCALVLLLCEKKTTYSPRFFCVLERVSFVSLQRPSPYLLRCLRRLLGNPRTAPRETSEELFTFYRPVAYQPFSSHPLFPGSSDGSLIFTRHGQFLELLEDWKSHTKALVPRTTYIIIITTRASNRKTAKSGNRRAAGSSSTVLPPCL